MFKQSFTNIKLKNTTTHEIGKIIKELKSKKSRRYDEITTKTLKISSPFIVSPVTYMCIYIYIYIYIYICVCVCNRMLPNRTFPD